MSHRRLIALVGTGIALALTVNPALAQDLIFSDDFESGDTLAWTRACTAEVCGDGLDNNCNGIIDDPLICHPGVWVSALTGDDIIGIGTLEEPFQSIAAGISLAMTLGPNANVYCAEGVYPEKVAMIEGVNLLGGYQCDGVECTWDYDPSIHDSTIANVDGEGVVAGSTITRQTRLDGFAVQGMSGTPPPPPGYYAALTIDQGAPTVTNNRFYGGDILGCSHCQTNAVVVLSPSTDPSGPLVEGNHVHGGDAETATSIGIRLLGWPTATVAEIRGNTVHGGLAVYTRAIAADRAAPGTVIHGNRVFAGSTPVGVPGSSFAIAVGGTVVLDSNLVNTEPALVGTCPVTTFWCGGIEAASASGSITNNVVFGMPAEKSAGLLTMDPELPFGDLAVNGNTLFGGGIPTGSESAAIACSAYLNTGSGVGRYRNNILLGGEGGTKYGMLEEGRIGRWCIPEAFDNNDLSSADVLYRTWDGSTATDLMSTSIINGMSWADANISVDPVLDSTFHLQGGSQCIDAGTMNEAPSRDFEGDPRPLGLGVDIGADEAE